MFTGIIETIGEVVKLKEIGENLDISIATDLAKELKIDQSVAHNGVCLTVIDIKDNQYTVTAIAETLLKSNLNSWQIGSKINLERGIRLSDRLDGHIVQGHVDTVGSFMSSESKNGSTEMLFSFPKAFAGLVIPKGSICINGVSLTLIDPTEDSFKVAIIPYTIEHTNLGLLQSGGQVNLEFDILGKYLLRNMDLGRINKTQL